MQLHGIFKRKLCLEDEGLFSTVKVQTAILIERKEITFMLRGFVCTLHRRKKSHRILTADLHRFRFVVQVDEQGSTASRASMAGCEN